MPKKREPPQFVDEQKLLEKAYSRHAKLMADSQADYIQYDEGRTVGKEERSDIMERDMEFFRSRYHHQQAEVAVSKKAAF